MIEYVPGWQEAFLWVLIVACVVAFILAFSMGANDCANSYGTSVGSGVLKLWQAYCLATVWETTGAALLGYKVTNTIRKSIVNVGIYSVFVEQTSNFTFNVTDKCERNVSSLDQLWPCYDYTRAEYMLGALGSLVGCAIWLLLATLSRMPVSTTHTIVGATVGFSMVLKGPEGINWMQIVNIVISWVISPLLAGLFSISIYAIIKCLALNRKDPLEASLTLLPFLFLFGISVNLFSILYDGSKYIHLDMLTWWMALILSVGIGGLVAICVRVFAVGPFRKYILSNTSIDVSAPIVMDFNAHIGVSVLTKKSKKRQMLDFIPASNLRGSKSGSRTPRPKVSNPFKQKDFDEDGVVLTGMQTPTYEVGGSQTPLAPATPANYNRQPQLQVPRITQLQVPNNGQPYVNGVNNGRAKAKDGVCPELVKLTIPEEIPEPVPVVDPQSLRDKLRALKHPTEEHPNASKVFAALQVLSACFLSFSHGSNDTANAVGPLVAIFLIWHNGNALSDLNDDLIIQGLIIFGALSMVVGLWALGHKVIETVGTEITTITPASGFSMEIGTAFTVLFASKIGIPVSTTHCLVGAVVFVGWFKTRKGVSWSVFRNIILAWVVTLPATSMLSALAAWLLQFVLLRY